MLGFIFFHMPTRNRRSVNLAGGCVSIGRLAIGRDQPVRIMGVINLSPESFYQGSITRGEDSLSLMVKKLEKGGADIIDVGAASSAPSEIYGTTHIDYKEELIRVRGLLERVIDSTDLPVSIDTTSAEVAQTAIALGAAIVNDVSGLTADDRMAALVAEYDVPIVIMASCREACRSVSDSISALQKSIETARQAGIREDRIIIDPGIGFGKPAEVDLALLRHLHRFKLLRRPVLVGVSRKAFLGALLDQPDPVQRLPGTIAATTVAVVNGADVVRAHDAYEAVIAARVGQSLRRHWQSTGGPEVLELVTEADARIVLNQIGVEDSICGALAKKAILCALRVEGISTPAALVIKQEMLALGGDAAYHKDCIDFQVQETDVLIMGTVLQIERLCTKLRRMKYFNLDRVGTSIMHTLAEFNSN